MLQQVLHFGIYNARLYILFAKSGKCYCISEHLQVHDRHTSRVLTFFEISQHPSHFQNILANILKLVYRRTNSKWVT